ncbi:unnamed protein product [Cuscuta campestris]|uniref:Ribosomal protein S6 n=1 Tax=Cuscuta campestris TaxID=132261 RepID=A0A484LJ96_9ASTE|nr:unnamed protein product [Cuscuta campestris]
MMDTFLLTAASASSSKVGSLVLCSQNRNFRSKSAKLQLCSSSSTSSSYLPLPFSSGKLRFSSLIVASSTNDNNSKKKNKNKSDSHSFFPRPDEITFPEAVLLKEVKPGEDGKLLPEFADAEERALFDSLSLQLESDLDVERMRHYEVVYLIHEDHKDKVDSVNMMVQDFLKEKKGKVWRFNDWGMRGLAYKIRKANRAHYILMNFELDAKWINDFKELLDKDERVIRHLVMKRDKAETKDCPPPPDYYSLSGDDEVMDEYGDEDEGNDDEIEAELEMDDDGDDDDDDDDGGGDDDDFDGDDDGDYDDEDADDDNDDDDEYDDDDDGGSRLSIPILTRREKELARV